MTTKRIEVYCKNNSTIKQYEAGISLQEIYDDMRLDMKYPAIVASANNKTKNLGFCVYKPKEVEFMGINSESGMRAYVRTLAFVMFKAVSSLYTDVRLRIEHPVSNGLYCRLIDAKNYDVSVSATMVAQIKAEMQNIIHQNIPVEMLTIPTSKAVEIFQKEHAQDKINMLNSLGNLYSSVYCLDGLYDYYNGSLAPSTGYISLFDVMLYHNGILLRCPDAKNPDTLPEFDPQDKLYNTFAEYTHWNSIMGLANIGDVNLKMEHNEEDSACMLITVAETLQEKKIDHIADAIVSDPRKKVVLIAGPSSSGKTTFSKKLSIHLAVCGKEPIPFSMDDYFVDRDKTPKDEKGEFDFESVHAIDLPFFNQQLNQMLKGEEVELPYYNFTTGKREFHGNKIRLGREGILVIEGIHGLNPELTAQIPEENKFRIYASALTTISLDDHNWISTTDNRLLRRIVRDYKYRNYSAEDTINRWASVHRGEEKWIYPFREQADAMFNSALIFEIPVLKPFVEPILQQVPQYSPAYPEAYRLLKFLQFVKPIPSTTIPSTSLLREFFGGSQFRY